MKSETKKIEHRGWTYQVYEFFSEGWNSERYDEFQMMVSFEKIGDPDSGFERSIPLSNYEIESGEFHEICEREIDDMLIPEYA